MLGCQTECCIDAVAGWPGFHQRGTPDIGSAGRQDQQQDAGSPGGPQRAATFNRQRFRFHCQAVHCTDGGWTGLRGPHGWFGRDECRLRLGRGWARRWLGRRWLRRRWFGGRWFDGRRFGCLWHPLVLAAGASHGTPGRQHAVRDVIDGGTGWAGDAQGTGLAGWIVVILPRCRDRLQRAASPRFAPTVRRHGIGPPA